MHIYTTCIGVCFKFVFSTLTGTFTRALCPQYASPLYNGGTRLAPCLPLPVLVGPWTAELTSMATFVVIRSNSAIHCKAKNFM